MKQQILQALRQHAEGQIAKHKANVDVYLNSTTGIGEHSDILETLEKEGVTLRYLATWKDVLEVAEEGGYFDAAAIDGVRQFLDDPEKWSLAHGGRGYDG